MLQLIEEPIGALVAVATAGHDHFHARVMQPNRSGRADLPLRLQPLPHVERGLVVWPQPENLRPHRWPIGHQAKGGQRFVDVLVGLCMRVLLADDKLAKRLEAGRLG